MAVGRSTSSGKGAKKALYNFISGALGDAAVGALPDQVMMGLAQRVKALQDIETLLKSCPPSFSPLLALARCWLRALHGRVPHFKERQLLDTKQTVACRDLVRYDSRQASSCARPMCTLRPANG